MVTPEYIPSVKDKSGFGWMSGLKKENGRINGFGIHAYITLAVSLFYLISNVAFIICGNAGYFGSDFLLGVFENILFLDVLIWFTYLPYTFISIIVQISHAAKAEKASGLVFVNIILAIITPIITIAAMSRCF